jgi:L-alanine-DL-glutamate epimerase-like enolase superfamily enzyme
MQPTRRHWLLLPSLALQAASTPTIRIDEIRFELEDIRYRAPYKFGGVVMNHTTLLNVWARVRNPAGKVVEGFGSMPLSNLWAFPSREMSYDTTQNAMRVLGRRLVALTNQYRDFGHPIDINTALEPAYFETAKEVSQELKLLRPIPDLCTLVVASPIDAALHDAYGKLLGRSTYRTYSPDCLPRDLSHFLNADFRGEFLNRYVNPRPRPQVNLYHSVGGLDALTKADLTKPLNDGLPETLPDWIRFNGLHHIKIKLQGDDLQWDIERTVAIDRIAEETNPRVDWRYCVDFNERCPNVDALLEYLRKVKELSPRGFTRIEYIEQPTARDLKADRANRMHEAAKLRPVVIDESLTSLETLLAARDLGYTGVALKACKGQTQAMLMAAAAQKYNMFLCVQDLSCPGASLVHSAGIAAHVPGVSGIEANSRQYLPAANEAWKRKFPGLFVIRDGALKTAALTRPGLSAV